MSLYDLQGIAPAVKEGLFIPPPAPFSSAKLQQPTQLPQSLPDDSFEDIQGAVVSWLVNRTLSIAIMVQYP